MDRFFAWFHLPGSLVLTVIMSLTALGLAIAMPSTDRWLRAGAMLLSSLGDIILMNYTPIVKHLPKPMQGFIGGAAAFAVAHLVYFAAFFVLIHERNYSLINAGFWAGIVLTVVVAASLVFLAIHNRQDLSMLPLGMGYALVIGAVLTLVGSYAVSHGGFGWVLALGSVSFIISDYFIGLDVFCGVHSNTLQGLIWWFYPIGQLMLLFPR